MSAYAFGRFRLDPDRRALSADGEAVTLSSRAFDILQLLIEHRDRVVSKEEIIERVWEGVFVEENNLAVQISQLRKVLGDRSGGPQLILTVPGRGYRFVGDVDMADTQPPSDAGQAQAGAADAPPADPSRDDRASAAPRLSGARWPIWAAITVLLVASLAFGLIRSRSWRPTSARPDGPAIATTHTGEPPRLSIVVLPFRNLGGDPQEDYLADAIGDDLTTDLSHLPGSFVIARQSAELYKGRSVPAEQVGRELGVRYLLEGSVRRVDDKILINAQLIDSQTGSHLWADRFDTSRGKLSEAQAEIVSRIGSALDFTLVQIEGRRSYQDRPDNPDALDFFFRGRSILDREDSFKALTEAQGLFEHAIALQPDFAEAMSDLAWLLLIKVRDYDDPSVTNDVQEAETWLNRALQLAPDDAHALSTRGMKLAIDQKYDEAAESYRLALSFDRNSVEARLGLARCANAFGHPEQAVGLIEEALRIDPVNPRNRDRYHQLGMALLLQGRPEDANSWLQKASVGDPNAMEHNEMAMIAAYSESGRPSDARAKYLAYSQRWPHRTSWRIACLASKALSSLPGFKTLIGGLEAAGMPTYADETADDGIPSGATPRAAGDFEPAPLAIQGARTIRTAEMALLMHKPEPPVMIDVGCGAAVPRGGIWLNWLGDYSALSADERAELKRTIDLAAHGREPPVLVVMGSGTYGWDSYNAALAITGLGYRNVLWYRGGEEALAAAGLPSDDRRSP